MVEELGGRLRPDRVEEASLARLDQAGVRLGADHPTQLRRDVIAVLVDVEELADLVQVAARGLDRELGDAVEEALGQRPVGRHRHHELLGSDGEAALLEDPHPDDAGAHQGVVRGLVQPDGLLAHQGEDLRRVELRPAERPHRILGEVRHRELHPVEIEAALLGHPEPGPPAVDPSPVLALVDEGFGRRPGPWQGDRPRIDAEPLEQVLAEIRQLLREVPDRCVVDRQAEPGPKGTAGPGRDRGDAGRTEIDRHLVRLAVGEGRPDALPGVHALDPPSWRPSGACITAGRVPAQARLNAARNASQAATSSPLAKDSRPTTPG